MWLDVLSVRAKLILLVALAAVPAAFAAAGQIQDARGEILEQVQRRLDYAGRAFDRQMQAQDDDLRTALRIAAADPRVIAAARAGHATADMLATAGSVDPDALVMLVDSSGRVIASTDPAHAPPTIPQGTTDVAFEPLAGNETTWFRVITVPIDGGPERLVFAHPMDADFLGMLQARSAGQELALKVDDQLLAASESDPAPRLEVHGGGAQVLPKDGRTFALATFHPSSLSAPGHDVELTAARDVTSVIETSRHDLRVTLLRLGLASLVAIALAAWVAGGIGGAVRRISTAVGHLGSGDYPRVDVRGGDELAALGTAFNQMVEGLRERDRLRSTFGKFVARRVIEQALKQNPELGKGELVPVTVLFSDIRGFTSISEKMSPRGVVEFLNLYFTAMVESVTRHGGEVDKFIGDAILAVFGSVTPKPDDPLQAVLAAIDMKNRLRDLNIRFHQMGLPEIRIGIGIHTGNVLAGTIGHEQRMEYTVIGDAVNLASRLETATKELQVDILLSESTYQAIKDQIEAEPVKRIKVKGREQEVTVFRLVGLTGSHTIRAPQG